jgi:hypothetical protein
MKRKTCPKCNKTKSHKEFSKNKRRADKLECYCKECVSKLQKKAYRESPALAKNILKNQRSYRERNALFIRDYLSTHPCVDCGESDPVVLEFDHRNPEEKTANVSALCSSSSIKKIEKEITKCEVRCANCHRRKTANQFGWYSFLRRDQEHVQV